MELPSGASGPLALRPGDSAAARPRPEPEHFSQCPACADKRDLNEVAAPTRAR